MQLARTRLADLVPQAFPANSQLNDARESPSGLNTFERIVQCALDCAGANGAALAMFEDQVMVCVARAGSLAPPLGARLETGSGLTGKCLLLRRVLRCDDAESDSRIDRETCHTLGIRSMVAVPIEENGFVVGLLEVFSRQARAFGEAIDAKLELLAKSALSVERGVSRAIEDKDSSAVAIEEREDSSQVSPDAPNPRPMSAFVRSRSIYYKLALGLGFTCLAIAIVCWWIRGRRVLAPLRTDVQTVLESTGEPDSGSAGTNERPTIRQLAEQGDPSAQFALGAQYATGDNVRQDFTEAARWFSKAAEQGHVLAQATLGAYYLAGRGVPTDLSKAYFWSILAQAGGDQASEYRINLLNSRLTPEEISDVKQQASDWLKLHHPSTVQ